jgi:anaerobic dimethyl sulfoxide reductase subunit B (iron-sulfur subunit)
MRALDFGPLDELIRKYGNVRDIEDLPKSTITKPAIVFKPHQNKKKIIPYNEGIALQLMTKRGATNQQPNLNLSEIEMNDMLSEIVGRNRLQMKSRSSKLAVRATQHDE